MKRAVELNSLQWIAELSPGNCPGGVPSDEAGWRALVNRIVVDVRRVLSESDAPGVSRDHGPPSDRVS